MGGVGSRSHTRLSAIHYQPTLPPRQFGCPLPAGGSTTGGALAIRREGPGATNHRLGEQSPGAPAAPGDCTAARPTAPRRTNVRREIAPPRRHVLWRVRLPVCLRPSGVRPCTGGQRSVGDKASVPSPSTVRRSRDRRYVRSIFSCLVRLPILPWRGRLVRRYSAVPDRCPPAGDVVPRDVPGRLPPPGPVPSRVRSHPTFVFAPTANRGLRRRPARPASRSRRRRRWLLAGLLGP